MIQLPIRTLSAVSAISSDPPPVTPVDLGLPAKFTEWRTAQWDAVNRIINSPKRFVVICAATGFGKTLAYAAASVLSGDRTVILTATKGLQDQISSDFSGLSSDIRGLNNYLCPITDSLGIPKDTSVADAPCQCGYGCRLRRGGCGYYDSYIAAQRSNIVSTNYACWMYDGAKQDSERGDLQHGIPVTATDVTELEAQRNRQRVRMLIADEAHEILESVSLFVGVDFSRHECLQMRLDWPDSGLTVDDWQRWAIEWNGKVSARVTQAEQKLKSSGGKGWSRDLKHLRDLKRKLDRLSGMRADDDWILNEEDVEGKSMASVRFDPLSPARYAESALWRGIDKIVLVSATVRPKTAELLGIDKNELEFVEYDSSFDPKRRPVVFIPTVRMDFRTEQDDHAMRWMLSRIDDLIDARLDRKGIIHAVSYARSKFIVANSRHARLMITHGKHDKMKAIERFRQSDAPCVLVSPSVDTGFDFAGSQARYQLLIKIPFVSKMDKVVAARSARDKEYPNYIAAQTIVQMTGRIMRSENDFGESILTDSHAEWFIPKVRRFLPEWWLEAYRVQDKGLPEPLQFDDNETTQVPCSWCDEHHEGGPEMCKS